MHGLTSSLQSAFPTTSVGLINPLRNRASIDQCDLVYRVFVRELGLRRSHKEHLQHIRGLPPVAFERFASSPHWDSGVRRHLARRVIDRLGDECVLHGVPGFLVDRDGHWTCKAIPSGILIPIPDKKGRIQALQVRLDRCSPRGVRYIWYSSRGESRGFSPGSPVAYWGSDRTTSSPVLITEGSLKAAIASEHLRAQVIGVPGVSNWRSAIDLPSQKMAVAIAFDADARTNPFVAHHQLELARALFWAGHPVTIATWDPRYKGVDDAILARASINLKFWPAGTSPTHVLATACPGEVSVLEAYE